ncbi:type II secretion system F family protein [Clostridium sp. Cult2]|uniref:type II secretion system F family protein n=1 Tax=Clostridium sp. Cult2 TaxID=2079003 RepID=UPI001F2BB79C|nr:type II secretion system F family protein [Clostridium sp. Cult2]MCF6466674.1 type II secretion system protein [Clostridium sp. Cult2]
MKYLIYFLVIITVAFIFTIIYYILFSRRKEVKKRLDDVKDLFKDHQEETILSQPFNDRIIKPLYQKVVGLIGKVTPYQVNHSLQKIIAYAGEPNNITVNRFIAIQIMLAIIIPATTYILYNTFGNNKNKILLILLSIVGFIIPIYILRIKAKDRQMKIQKSLPDMLDLLFVSVEAGLGFDMALKRTTEKMPGPLSEEFNRALDEINKGRKRENALRAVAHRTGVNDLSTFISAVIQSEQLGSNIANMLRIQSSSMRQKRRQRAEELAMKVPIKMLFPLVFFMLPALFIVILGPAVIRIVSIFGEIF